MDTPEAAAMQQSLANKDIPRRHGIDMQVSRRLAKPLKRTIRDNPEPNSQRWREIGEGLLCGDPAMDSLVDWMAGYGMGPARQLFAQALEAGIDSLDAPPEPLCRFFAHIERRPHWVDDALLERGAEACHLGGLMSLRVLRDLSLMAGYQAAAINKTLVLTGALERGPQRRLAETTKWWLDCTATGGMTRFADGFKSTLHVRLIHSLIRRRVQAMDDWDVSESGVPINQTDMAATHLAFSVNYLLGSRILGVPFSRRDGQAVMHLWRYIDWLMGVDAYWLPETEQQGRVLLYQILLSQAPPDETSRALGGALKDEPLARYYTSFGWLRGRYERARHLSIARLFVDKQGMRDLGLPTYTLPWYPLLAGPANLARHTLGGALPGGRRKLALAGRQAQEDYLKTLFGEQQPAIHSPASA